MSEEEDFGEWDNCEPTEENPILVGSPYEIKEISFAEELMNEQAKEISDIFSVTQDQAICILKYFKWNSDTVQSKWFEDEAINRMRCGISFDKDLVKSQGLEELLGAESISDMCLICFGEISESHPGAALECGHRFCSSCWEMHCTVNIAKGKECVNMTCPYAGCFMQIPCSFVKRFTPPEKFSRYMKFLLRSFTDDNKSIRWCPSPGCSYFANLLYGVPDCVTCKCGTQFCFQCGEEPHPPISCEMLREWHKKNMDNGENYLWLMANTKPCPKCKTDIINK